MRYSPIPRCIHTRNWDSYLKEYRRYSPVTMQVLESRPEVKVKIIVTQEWYVPLCHPKMHPHTKFGILTSNNIKIYAMDTIILETRIPRIKRVAWQNQCQTRQIHRIYINQLGVILKKSVKQNINPISPTPKFNLGIRQIIIKSLSTILENLVQ